MRILGPDRTREKNGDNSMLKYFIICNLRHIIRLNDDGWGMTASKTSEENRRCHLGELHVDGRVILKWVSEK